VTPAVGPASHLCIGDVHGELDALEEALTEARARGATPVLLGDLVDSGPDSAGVLRRVLPAIARGEMLFVRGNHDEKLVRCLSDPSRVPNRTAVELRAAPDADALIPLAVSVIGKAPYWVAIGGTLVVHGAFHPDMLGCPPRGGHDAPKKLKALALYAETDGRKDADGFPIRTHRWVDRIPEGLQVVVGHDVRSREAPVAVTGALGGRAVFLDTGCGKGGRLSTLVIDGGERSHPVRRCAST